MPGQSDLIKTGLLITCLPFLMSVTDLYAEDARIYRQTRLAPSDPESVVEFGRRVQIAGRTAVVLGTEISSWSPVFYVFHFQDGRWVEQARLGMPDFDYELVGQVEASASRFVFGSPGWDDPECFDGNGEGRVFVFERDGEDWRGPDEIGLDDGCYGGMFAAFFGNRVDLSGNRIAVGGYSRLSSDGYSGYAHVYVRNDSGWQLDDTFGCTAGADACAADMHIDGDVLILGAAGGEHAPISDIRGEVHVFERTNGQWAKTVLFSAGAAANPPEPCEFGGVQDNFGDAVAISQGRLAILDPQSCDEFGVYQGNPIQTLIYEKSGENWQPVAAVPDVIPLGLERNRMWVEDTVLAEQAIYTRAGSTWSRAAVLDNLGPFESLSHRVSFDFDGGAIIAGDPQSDISGPDVGSAVIYSLSRFDDVAYDHWAYDHIEALGANGITSGCGVGIFCPQQNVTRGMMAVFLVRAIHNAAITPPPASGTVFSDVGPADFAADYIEQLAADGITTGCGGGNYCPDSAVTRAQMAVLLLRAKHGADYSPPAAAGDVFDDVNSNHWAAAWIEQLASEGITNGCGGQAYCPDETVSRAHMAAFIGRTFGF